MRQLHISNAAPPPIKARCISFTRAAACWICPLTSAHYFHNHRLLCSQNRSKYKWNIKLDKLQEVDADGKTLSGRSVSLNFDFMSGTGALANGVSYLYINGSQTFSSTQAFGRPVITWWSALFSEQTTMTLRDNVTIPVLANVLKQSLTVRGWIASPQAQYLQLRMKISNNVPNSAKSYPFSKASKVKQDVLLPTADSPVSALLIFEDECYVGDGMTLAPVVLGMDGKNDTNTFNFPPSSNIFWDPEITTYTNGAAATGLSVAALLLAAGVAMLSLW